jgi:hypothetical protein
MLQIRRCSQRFKRLVGKFLDQKIFQLLAVFFTHQLARRSLEFGTHKFQAIRTRAAKSFDRQHQPRFRMVRNGYDAPSEVVLL